MSLLVDFGLTHKFINAYTIRKLGLKEVVVELFKVNATNGDKLKCKKTVQDVKMNVKGVRITIDLQVLLLVRLDMILNNAWLNNLSNVNVIMNSEAMKIEFKLGSEKKSWTIVSFMEILSCNVAMLEKLCKSGA